MTNQTLSLDKPLTSLKKDRVVQSNDAAVEVLAFFLLIRACEIKFDDGDGLSLYSIDDETYRDHCYKLIDNLNQNQFSIGGNRYAIDKIIGDLQYALKNISGHPIFNEINAFFSSITTESDIRLMSLEFNALVERMAYESPITGYMYTSEALKTMMVQVLSPQHGDTVYDPACGTGGFLIEAEKYVRDHSIGSDVRLIGKEKEHLPFLFSLVNLVLSGGNAFQIECVDTILQNQNKNENKKYDVILTNPPFGKQNQKYRNHRFKDEYLEYHFLYHAIRSLKPDGKVGIILPERFLSDKNSSGFGLRREIFRAFNVDCILKIPPGSMPHNSVKVIVLFFSNTEPTGETWVYQLNQVERFTRKKRLSFDMFDDFFKKYPKRKESENSWSVRLDSDDFEFQILKNPSEIKNYTNFQEPDKIFTKIQGYRQNLSKSLDDIATQLSEIRNEINQINNNNKFSFRMLGDLVKNLPSKPLSKNELKNSGAYEVYGGNGVIGNYKEYLHSGEFIVIGRVGAHCGNVRYVEGKIWVTNNALAVVCTDNTQVYPPYLAKVLAQKNLRSLASGTAQPHITVGQIKKIEVPLPPVKVQKVLNHWLSKFEKELSLQSQLIESISMEGQALNASLHRHLMRI